MAHHVVDALEVVDVDHEDGGVVVRAQLRRQVQRVLEGAPVCEPGEAIGVGLVARSSYVPLIGRRRRERAVDTIEQARR